MMSDKEDSAADKSTVSEMKVLSRNKGHDLAMKAKEAQHDYTKVKTSAQWKSLLLERD